MASVKRGFPKSVQNCSSGGAEATGGTEKSGWIPDRIEVTGHPPKVRWRPVGSARFVEPFFEDTLRRTAGEEGVMGRARWTGVEALWDDLAPDSDSAPQGIIYHASRCGSTLVAQSLASDPDHLVLSEPPPVDAWLRWAWRQPAGVAVAGLRGWVGALRSAYPERHRVFLKLDAWLVARWSLVREAFPTTPWVFVYRDPVEILRSHQRRWGSHMVPGTLPDDWWGLTEGLGRSDSLEEHAARVLAALGDAALTALAGGGGRLLHYPDLPAVAGEPLRRHFGIRDAATTDLDWARRHAKHPELRFEADGDAKRAEATPELNAVVQNFAAPVYARLEAARRSGWDLAAAPTSA